MIEGQVWKYGDNVDTDVILPGRYVSLTDPADLAVHCLEDLDPHFAKEVQPGDIIVANWNFGSGSSREVAPLAIQGSGISCIVAASFAPIFYRNAINIGLPILVSPQTALTAEKGDLLRLDLTSGLVENVTRCLRFRAEPFPPLLHKIVSSGGLLPYLTNNRYVAKIEGVTHASPVRNQATPYGY